MKYINIDYNIKENNYFLGHYYNKHKYTFLRPAKKFKFKFLTRPKRKKQ